MTVRLLLAVAAALTLAGLSGSSAQAATASTAAGFSISPPVHTFSADRGKSINGTIKVTNLTDQPISLVVEKSNFAARGEEGEVELQESNPRYSLAPWFRISTPTLEIPAKKTSELKFSVDVPADAEPGGRYGSILVRTSPNRLPSGQSGAAVQQQLASLIFLRINGTANEKLEIASFGSDKSNYEYGPVKLNTRIKNVGNVHEKPSGTIEIKNVLGMKVATLPLEDKFVIPDSVRKLTNEWKPGPWLVGPFTANLTVNGPNSAKLTAKATFIVFPWKVALVVLIILIALFLFLRRGRKRLGRSLRVLFGRD